MADITRKLEADLKIARFSSSEGIRGPHPISRQRQVRNQFHRIFSPKSGNRIVVAESQLEADSIIYFESREDVVSICEQPMRIDGSIEKRPYYTFDIGIKRSDGVEIFIEVKPEGKLPQGKDGSREPSYWQYIKTWCTAHGFECAVLTDEEINKNKILIRNWRSLLGFVNRSSVCPDHQLESDVLETIRHYPGLSIHEIPNHIVQKTDEGITCAVSSLLHRHILNANLGDALFTRHTPIYVQS